MKTLLKKVSALTLSVILIMASLVVGFVAQAAAPADSEASYYNEDGKGIRATLVEYPFQLKTVDQMSNLDFEDGFRFWAGGKGKGTYGATAFNIVTDGDNSYGKIPDSGYVSNFQTALFKIENVAAGDKIVVVYDVKGADGNKIRIKVEQEYVKSIAVYDETTGLNTTTKADGNLINVTPGVPVTIVGTGVASSNFATNLTDGWTTLVTSSTNTLVAPSTGSSYTSDPIADAFYIKLLVTCGDAGVAAGDVIDAAVDNIRIAKVVDGIYTNVVTGEVIYDPANPPETPGDDTTDGVVHPDYYGPADKGFNSWPSNLGTASWPCHLKPADDIYNLDFSDGFMYWTGHDCSSSAGRWGGSRAYTFYDLVTTSSGNTYIQAKTPYQTTIMTAIFTAKNVAVGDELVVIYDAKGADAEELRPFVRQAIIKTGITYDETTGMNNTSVTYPSPGWGKNLTQASEGTPVEFDAQLTGNGWTTYILGSSTPVEDVSTNSLTTAECVSDILLQVKLGVSTNITDGTAIDAAIDNIRIAKVVDGIYYDVATNEVIYDPANPPAPPEEEPVFEADPPKNLDFSEGFKYWTGETSIYSVENGVLKTNDTYTSGSWRWLKTEKFNVPNAVSGTTVKVTFDVEFEDDLLSMKDHADYQEFLSSTYGYKLLDTYLYQYETDGTEKDNKRKEIFYNNEGKVTLGPITVTNPEQEFEFWISCGNSSKKAWEVTNIVVTVTHPDGTVETYPTQPIKPQISADALAWLMNLILTNNVEDMSADFNDDGAVNLLDVVYVKKELVKIANGEAPITGPTYAARTEDVYSYNIVRYDIGGTGESVGWYFTPKEEGNYQTIILIHGQGNPTTFRDNLVYNFNKWVKAGYIEPMVVVIPEVLNSYGPSDAGSSNIDDFQYYIYESRPNRFNALLTSIEKGTLSSKIDTSKKPYVAGFSMGGMAALHAGADYNTRIDKCGALSPGKSFYLGDGNWGFYNYASDIYFSSSEDALVYLSAGAAETDFSNIKGAFVDTINMYESGIKVNNADIITKFIAPESWGNHGWVLAQMEIFMFLQKASFGRLPTNELVETVCSQPYPSASQVPTVVYSAADEHK